MKISGSTRVAAVIGSPVSHSLSPFLMNSWIAAAGIDATYIALPAKPSIGIEDLRSLSRSGLAGLNVTLPFKPLAVDAADIQSETVKRTGAANLLCFREDGIHAFNTDIDGIFYALEQAGSNFVDKRVLIFGAGGVARALCEAARQGGVESVSIVNRTPEKAQALAKTEQSFEFHDWENRQAVAASADLIINATSLGLDGKSYPDLDWRYIPETVLAFDTLYTPASRPFLKQAAATGHKTIDGLPMFYGQALPSFEKLFESSVPENAISLQALAEELGR